MFFLTQGISKETHFHTSLSIQSYEFILVLMYDYKPDRLRLLFKVQGGGTPGPLWVGPGRTPSPVFLKDAWTGLVGLIFEGTMLQKKASPGAMKVFAG